MTKDGHESWLDCGICLELMLPERDPVVSSGCRAHLFCRACLENVHPRVCPSCRKEFTDLVPIRDTGLSFHLYQSARVACRHGCSQPLQIADLAAHDSTCTKALFSCPNEGCSLELRKTEYDRHLNDCVWKRFDCAVPGCGFRGTRQQLALHGFEEVDRHLALATEREKGNKDRHMEILDVKDYVLVKVGFDGSIVLSESPSPRTALYDQILRDSDVNFYRSFDLCTQRDWTADYILPGRLVPKQQTFDRFKDTLADELGIPVDEFRLWSMEARANKTSPPCRPIEGADEIKCGSILDRWGRTLFADCLLSTMRSHGTD